MKMFCHTCGIEITESNFGSEHNHGVDCDKCFAKYVDEEMYYHSLSMYDEETDR